MIDLAPHTTGRRDTKRRGYTTAQMLGDPVRADVTASLRNHARSRKDTSNMVLGFGQLLELLTQAITTLQY